jgi:hypothetical protein
LRLLHATRAPQLLGNDSNESAGTVRFTRHFRHILFNFHFFQQVDSRALLASDGAAEFRNEKPSFEGFSESPARLPSPGSGQQRIFSFYVADVAGNLNRNSLAIQRASKVAANWLSITIEPD